MRYLLAAIIFLTLSSQECFGEDNGSSYVTLEEFLKLDGNLIVDGNYDNTPDFDLLRKLYGSAISAKNSSRNFENEFDRNKYVSTHKTFHKSMEGRAHGKKPLPRIKERAFFPISDKNYDFEKQQFKLCPYFEQNNFKRWRDRYGSNDTLQLRLNMVVNNLDFTKHFSFWAGGCLYKKVPIDIAENYLSSANIGDGGRKGFYGFVHLNPRKISQWSYSRIDVSLSSQKFEIEDNSDGTISIVTSAK